MIMMTLLATAFTVTYSLRLFILTITKSGCRGAGIYSVELWGTSGPIRVLFLLAVIRGALMGWIFVPSFIISLPKLAKLIIFAFIIIYVSYWVMVGSVGISAEVFNKVLFKISVLGFLASLWWLRNLAVKWLSLLKSGGKFVKLLDQG